MIPHIYHGVFNTPTISKGDPLLCFIYSKVLLHILHGERCSVSSLTLGRPRYLYIYIHTHVCLLWVFNVPQSSLNTSYTIMGCTVPHTHQTGWPNGLSHLTQVILHKYTSYIYIKHILGMGCSAPHTHQTGWPNGLSHLTQVILHIYIYIYI